MCGCEVQRRKLKYIYYFEFYNSVKLLHKMDENIILKKISSIIAGDWKLVVLVTSIFFIYYYYTSTFNYFYKKGVRYMKPIIFFGNLYPRLTGKISFAEFQLQVYNNFKGNSFGGIFEGRRPIFYIVDPDLVKAITIRDFEHFIDRGALSTNEPRYLNRFLLNLRGSEWKAVRSVITPTFSSFRLKNMFPIMTDSSKKFSKYLDTIDCSSVEMKKVLGFFTLDVIGACAFGIDTPYLNDENSEFVKAAENFNYLPISKRIILLSTLIIMPNLLKYINISFVNQESIKTLIAILKKAKNERRTSGKKRNDLLQLLIDASIKEQEEGLKAELDDDTIDAQSLLFLLAGFETSSTTASFAVYNLAVNPDVQDKLRSHVEEVTKGEELSYEHLSELDYLEGLLLETLRMYPPVARIDRVCVKPYTLPGSNIRLEVNDKVALPVYGFHMDADIYPEPEKCKPERFTREGKQGRPGHLFLGFGSGPRNCIGLRFAMVSMKLAMVTLIRNYKFSICPKTEIPLKINKNSMLLTTQNGIWVKMEKIEQ